MTQLHETAYPRLKADLSVQDIEEVYTLTPDEIGFIDQTVKRPTARTVAFLYLKLFQRLGYFIRLKDVPPVIRQHIDGTHMATSLPCVVGPNSMTLLFFWSTQLTGQSHVPSVLPKHVIAESRNVSFANWGGSLATLFPDQRLKN